MNVLSEGIIKYNNNQIKKLFLANGDSRGLVIRKLRVEFIIKSEMNKIILLFIMVILLNLMQIQCHLNKLKIRIVLNYFIR